MRSGAVVACLIVLSSIVGACGRGSACGDGPGADNVVAGATRWVLVKSMTDAAGQGTLQVSMVVVPVAADKSEGSPGSELITIHSSFLPGIHDALAGHKAVFLAFTSVDAGSEAEVYYVIVRGQDGVHHFVGKCNGEQLFRERFGGSYDSTIDSIIGLTDRARIAQIIGCPPQTCATANPSRSP